MSNHEAYIMEQLSHAPDEMSRAYELTLTRMMTASDTPLNIRSVLDLLQDQNKPESLRYACFVMATIWYRHMKDMLNVEDLLHRYGKKNYDRRHCDRQHSSHKLIAQSGKKE